MEVGQGGGHVCRGTYAIAALYSPTLAFSLYVASGGREDPRSRSKLVSRNSSGNGYLTGKAPLRTRRDGPHREEGKNVLRELGKDFFLFASPTEGSRCVGGNPGAGRSWRHSLKQLGNGKRRREQKYVKFVLIRASLEPGKQAGLEKGHSDVDGRDWRAREWNARKRKKEALARGNEGLKEAGLELFIKIGDGARGNRISNSKNDRNIDVGRDFVRL